MARRHGVVLVCLIPKPDGGRRPLGILSTVVRIWERTRKLAVQERFRTRRRSFGWATQGKSAESAACQQCLLDEAATADGLSCATTFVDLTKAFEMVRLEDTWKAGVHFGFPLIPLRLIL